MEWKWVPVGMSRPILHLVAGWSPSTGADQRWDTACGKSEPLVIVSDEGGPARCVCCLQRLLLDAR